MHADDTATRTYIGSPSQHRSLLDGEAGCHRWRQHLIPIGLRLLLENVPGRHRDDTRPNPPRCQCFLGLDDQGHFAFREVPPGEYFVAGEATWDRPGGGDYLAQWACERITVHKGQMVNIRVTHNPQHGNSPINNIFTVE